MSTFLTFLGLVFLFMIGKFIYDTYLTDNTEKDWEEYKMSHPHEAKVIENNKGLSFKTEHKIRKNGIYIWRHEGTSQYGQHFKLTMIIAFNNLNRVVKTDTEGHPEISQEMVKGIIEEISNYTETDSNCAEYYQNEGLIKMKFMNSTTHGEEYSGSVLEDGLLLTRTLHYWDEMLEGPNTKISLTDMHFKFLSIK